MDNNFSFDLVALANLAKLERLIDAYQSHNQGYGAFERTASRAEAIDAIIRGWLPNQSFVDGGAPYCCRPSGTISASQAFGNEAATTIETKITLDDHRNDY